MAPRSEEDPAPAPSVETDDDVADLAQAYRELAKGEQAATAMEANLSNLEGKLDALLAAFEATEKEVKEANSDDKTENGEKKDVKEDSEKRAPADGKST